MRLLQMLATPRTAHNEAGDPELQERRADVRSLLVLRRAGAFATVAVIAGALLGVLSIQHSTLAVLVVAAVSLEIGYQLPLRARTVESLQNRLMFPTLLYATQMVAFMHYAADMLWLPTLGLGLNGVVAAVTLSSRRVIIVTVYSCVAFLAYALLAFSGVVDAHPVFAGGAIAPELSPASETPERMWLTFVSILLLTTFMLPALPFVAHSVTHRLRTTRDALARTSNQLAAARAEVEASREQLAQWNAQLHDEIGRKTADLEAQNRYLAGLNAISFALTGQIGDRAAYERVARLVVRILELEVAQLHTRGANEAFEVIATVADSSEPPPPVPFDESVIEAAAREGMPVFNGSPGSSEEPWVSALVPVASKGEVLGVLTVSGRRKRPWTDQDRHLLAFVGRELGSAIEAATLYGAAVATSDQEATLSEVLRALASEADLDRAVGRALDVLSRRLGAVFVGVRARLGAQPGANRASTLAVTVARASAEGTRSTAYDGLAATSASLVRDRDRPLILGPRGEDVLSDATRQLGLGSMAIAPVIAARVDEALGTGRPARPSVVGALVLGASSEQHIGREHADLLGRIADGIGRRLEAEDLVRVQSRRIRELSGLARVAAVVQSTVDTSRLYAGFAQAMSELTEYRRLAVARFDESSAMVEVSSYLDRGRAASPSASRTSDESHRWYDARVPLAWARDIEAPPSWVSPEDDYGIVVPLRPRGVKLGLVFVATVDAPSEDLVAIAGQAVEQLALALDSATLFRQATDRAARIQVLGHLARIVASAADLREAFGAFSDEVRWLIPFDRAVMLLVDRSGEVLPYATYPETVDAPAGDAATRFAREAIEAGQPTAFARADGQSRDEEWAAFGHDARVVAMVPIVTDGGSAVFALTRNSDQQFTSEEFGAMQEVADLLAVTIDRVRMYDEAEYQAGHDSLTGLPNLRSLNDELVGLAPALEDGGTAALLMIDMDDLKVFNDMLGHHAGDRVIQIVARALQRAVRSIDMVARVGGDEFVVLMRDVGEEVAVEVAERIHESLWDAHDELPDAPTRVRVSIGIAVGPEDGTDSRALITAADEAMYEAKFAGGRRTRLARDRRGSLRGRRFVRQPNRVVARLVEATLAGATPQELELAHLAERYVLSAAVQAGVAPESTPPLRMLLLTMASARTTPPDAPLDEGARALLIEGLNEEWAERVADHAELGSILSSAAIELAWRQAPPPVGNGEPPEAILAGLRDEHPEWEPAIRALEAAINQGDDSEGVRAA
ncbi:MAG: diguanylate cyclase [Dehalococcoidia bacterium]